MGGRAVVMGLGLFGGGVGAVRHLCAKGYRVLVTDLRTESELAESIAELAGLDVDWRLGEHRLADFTSASVVVKNPGVKPGSEHVEAARRAGAEITSEIRLFLEACPCRVAAVTGSNGKTTTVHMAAEMLRREFGDRRRVWLGGNVGGSLLSELPSMTANDVAVLELSSFQLMDLDEAKLSPPVAAVTNITPNHLDWHRDLAEYVRAKSAIFRHQGPEGVAVLNADDPVTARLHEAARGRVVRYSCANRPDVDAYMESGRMMLRVGEAQEMLFSDSDVMLPGVHNVSNAACAALVAHACGASGDAIRRGLRGFRGVEHRLEFVAEKRGIRWYNDSIATTPESTMAALDSFRVDPVVLLLGGSDKGLSFDALANQIAMRPNVQAVYLNGPVAPKIADALRRACALYPDPKRTLQIEKLAQFDHGVPRAVARGREGTVFLMSPACASFYEYAPGKFFRNFEHRGKHFKQQVAEL